MERGVPYLKPLLLLKKHVSEPLIKIENDAYLKKNKKWCHRYALDLVQSPRTKTHFSHHIKHKIPINMIIYVTSCSYFTSFLLSCPVTAVLYRFFSGAWHERCFIKRDFFYLVVLSKPMCVWVCTSSNLCLVIFFPLTHLFHVVLVLVEDRVLCLLFIELSPFLLSLYLLIDVSLDS